jgi:hypothetical protein
LNGIEDLSVSVKSWIEPYWIRRKEILKKIIVSGIILTILLASILMLAFSVQSIEKNGIISNVADGLADFGGESGGFEAQSGSVD